MLHRASAAPRLCCVRTAAARSELCGAASQCTQSVKIIKKKINDYFSAHVMSSGSCVKIWVLCYNKSRKSLISSYETAQFLQQRARDKCEPHNNTRTTRECIDLKFDIKKVKSAVRRRGGRRKAATESPPSKLYMTNMFNADAHVNNKKRAANKSYSCVAKIICAYT